MQNADLRTSVSACRDIWWGIGEQAPAAKCRHLAAKGEGPTGSSRAKIRDWLLIDPNFVLLGSIYITNMMERL